MLKLVILKRDFGDKKKREREKDKAGDQMITDRNLLWEELEVTV